MESSSPPRASTSDADSNSPPLNLRTRYPWVTHEVLSTRSLLSETDVAQLKVPVLPGCELRSPGEDEPICAARETGYTNFFFFYREYLSRLGVRFPFTEFQMSALNHLRIAPSQLHPNGWGYLVAFEHLCRSFTPALACTPSLFFYFFDPLTPRSGRESPELKGLTSLRSEADKRIFTPFSDSFKHFKTSFFKVVAKPGEAPWFLSGPEGPEVEWRFPLYWSAKHHDVGPSTYQFSAQDLTADEQLAAATIASYVAQNGVKSAAVYVKDFKRRMEDDSDYLAYVRSDAGVLPPVAPPLKTSRKRAAVEPAKKSAADAAPTASKDALAKKAKVGGRAPPRPAQSAGMPSSVVDKGKGLSSDAPSLLAAPPVFGELPRSLAWEKGITEELRPAFLPPSEFLGALPLSSADEAEVHRVMTHLCKAVGVSHAYLHLRGEYVKSTGDVQRLTVDLGLAQEKAQRLAAERQQLEEERERAQETSLRAEEELRRSKAALDQSKLEVASLKSAHLLELDSVKSLTQQRAVLAQELEETRGELDGTRIAYEKAVAMVKKAAKQCFNAALAQLQFLNPGVQLNTDGYDYRAFIKDGVLVPPPPSPEDNPIPVVEPSQSEQVGGESTSAADPDLGGAPVDEAALS